MKNIVEFLTQLQGNNNKPWFDAHKEQYKVALNDFNSFVEKLIAGLGQMDSSVQGLTLKDCTYRIYRDTRFSHNKEPYKTHMGAYIAPKGKKSGYAGYYFHIEPTGGNLIGRHMISSGLYMPESKVLRSVREDIVDNGEEFLAAVRKAKGFVLECEEGRRLKRVPTGFSAESPYAEYLKFKDINLMRFLDDARVTQDGLLEYVLAAYEPTVDFVRILNRAVLYAYEEM